MGEAGEDPPLVDEAADDPVGVHAPLDQLERDLPGELLLVADRQVDRPHAAPSQLGEDAVGSDPQPLDRGPQLPLELGSRCQGSSLQALSFFVGGEQAAHLVGQGGVLGSGFGQPALPQARRHLEDGAEDVLDAPPALSVHRALEPARAPAPSRPWRVPSRA